MARTLDEIARELAELAIASRRPLERTVGETLHGRWDPEDPPWPRRSQEIWEKAVPIYLELREQHRQMQRKAPVPAAAEALKWTWRGVLLVAEEPDRWWRVLDMSWSELATALRASQTQLQYRYRVTGWVFRGVPGYRRVVQAPCSVCGSPASPLILGSSALCRECEPSAPGGRLTRRILDT